MAYFRDRSIYGLRPEENGMIEENERINRLFPWTGDSEFQYLVFDTVLLEDCSDNEKLECLEKIYDNENFFEILKKVKGELLNLYTIDPEAARNKAQNILLLIGAIDEYNNILTPFGGVVNTNVDEESNDIDFSKKNEIFKKKFRNFVGKLGIKNK